jgi:omega-6 fatty acid desaturase (delta-12 desaturase)
MDNNLVYLKINESDLFVKYKPSYKSALLDFSFHTFLMCSLFYSIWCFRNSWLSFFTIPLLGFMLNRSFIIFHDCCHNSYTPNKQLNYVISHITGALVSTSPNWILDHHTHHKTNGNIENEQHYFFNETIILTKKQFLSSNNKQQLFYKIYKNPLVFFTIVPIVYFGIIQRFIYIIKKYRHPDAFEQSLFMVTCDHIINNILSFLYLYTMFRFDIMTHCVYGFILASSIAFMTFHNQHSYNPSYVVENSKWTQRDSGLVGSSFIQIPTLLKYFYMGIEYHHIHHMNAKIPGYNLQKYHEEVLKKSDMFENIITLNMYDCYNNLWLVLYDEDKKRYITFEELENNKNL